ncbi:hypothetical protein [Roseobacter sinensis]|uniref:Uncharacterized protein n=1 Tax=Roseobacter sinensis TaxID=2931391 RepID=A0ABT3BCC4_9RHOB|nr:hypothetical protein [Roseobacter sp. WL0113]MCV3271059.1 hypothetical protein [Roseobacter sp. WL0113]
MHQQTDAAVDALVSHLRSLPLSDRSSRALGVASQLIEFAAFELAGRQSADDVADLIDCAARMDFASNDVQGASMIESASIPQRRLQ